MIDKTRAGCDEAVSDVFDGATVLLGGFGFPGTATHLIEALRRKGLRNLTVVSNGAGSAVGGLIGDGAVKKLIASFPNAPGAEAFRERYLRGAIELELVPQGTLAERIRAAGAGLGGFYTPTAAGTKLAEGKETRRLSGKDYVFETPLSGDFAFIRAFRADRLGNLAYRLTMRNFNLVMATAARVVIAEVDDIVAVGEISPEDVHTPGIFVDRVVRVSHESGQLPRKAGDRK